MKYKNEIVALSKELGFFHTGFAEANPFYGEIEYYEQWIASGRNATMIWMEKDIEKRRDVCKILPNAKTVIVVAINYFTDYNYDHTNNDKGKISRYAWGIDYRYYTA